MKYVVALTGGIGSGKSAVANVFSQFDINIIDADIVARQLVEPNTLALKAITERFGDSILNDNGTLNRRVLRERIFTDPVEKDWLNALLHPLIQQETQRQIAQAISPYVLWVVPLLVENQLFHEANRILVVDVLPQIQLQRTISRDSVSYQHAEHILANQVTREVRLSVADDVIDNNGVPDAISSEVALLHARYIMRASQASA